MRTDEQKAAFEAGAVAMKQAIEAKLKGWHDWIAKDSDGSHTSQMALCSYAGARTVVQLTAIPKPE